MVRLQVALLSCILLVVSIASTCVAQGLPVLPGFPVTGMQSVKFYPPKVSLEWMSCPSGISYGGHVGQWSVQKGFTNTLSFKAVIPNGGLWLGISQGIGYGPYLQLNLEGRYLFPQNRGFSSVLINPGVVFQDPEIRSWSPKNERWLLDGSVSYSPTRSCAIIVGLRYDSLYLIGSDPPYLDHSAFVAPGVIYPSSLPTDQLSLSLHNWLPYVGVMTTLKGSSSSVTARVIGFPWTGSSLKAWVTQNGDNRYIQNSCPNRSYFAEGYVEYGLSPVSQVSLSVFGRVTTFHGSQYDNPYANEGRLETVILGPPFTLLSSFRPSDFSVGITEYSVGGAASIRFDLPWI